jgi:hypothetical protein
MKKTFTEIQIEKAEKAICAKFAKNAKLAFYSNMANMDLYYGPVSSEEGEKFPWRGFSNALPIIREEFKKLNVPNEIYWDSGCEELLRSLPEGEEVENDDGKMEYIEPYLEDIFSFDSKEIKQIILGKELAEYV